MNGLSFNIRTPVLVDIGQDVLRLIDGDRDVETSLERHPNGRLTESSRHRLDTVLRSFLRPRAWQPRRRAICAIGARGVSVRRLTLPTAPPDQQDRLLRLQIESEFPLPPEALAWGELVHDGSAIQPTVDFHRREVLVVALRRDLIEDYRSLLSDCGLNPVFTLAALARAHLCPPTQDRWALLDLRSHEAELMLFERGFPLSLHCLPWGWVQLRQTPGCVLPRAAAESGDRLWVSGDFEKDEASHGVRQALSHAFGKGVSVEPVPVESHRPYGATLQGLLALTDHGRTLPPLTVKSDRALTPTASASGFLAKWAVAAVLLGMSWLLLRGVETAVRQSRLNRAITQVRHYRESLPLIDQQLGFLQYLQTNRHPYLRVIAAVAQSTTPGIQLESMLLNRRGDLLLRGTLRGQQPPTDFRTKLVESGAFTSVVLEEQDPGREQDKMAFRIAARWDPEAVRRLPEVPPVEGTPGLPAQPGMPMPMPGAFPSLPMASGAPFPNLNLPPGALPSPGMPMPVLLPDSGSPAEGSAPTIVHPPQAP